MFTHEMAHQVGGATHVHGVEILEDSSSRVKVSGVFGGMEPEELEEPEEPEEPGERFVPDPMLRPCQREIAGAERVAYEEFVQTRSGGKAPPQESRREDKIAWLDLHEWGVSTWEAEVEEPEA